MSRARRTQSMPVPGYEFGPDAVQRATADGLERLVRASGVILVEGTSDQIAVETMAKRLDRDLEAQGVVVVPIGGAHAGPGLIAHLNSSRADLGIRVLVDRAEAAVFTDLSDTQLFVCDPDLEYELIRALDPNEIERLLDERGDLRSLRTFQRQPEWRGQPFEAQMHRWLRARSSRGPVYAQALILAADPHSLEGPLVDVVNW